MTSVLVTQNSRYRCNIHDLISLFDPEADVVETRNNRFAETIILRTNNIGLNQVITETV